MNDMCFNGRVYVENELRFTHFQIFLNAVVVAISIPAFMTFLRRGYHAADMVALLLPWLTLAFISTRRKSMPVFASCKCKVELWDDVLYYSISGGKTDGYFKEYGIKLGNIDCVEYDPPSRSLRINARPYDFKEYEGDELLEEDTEYEKDSIYLHFKRKKDAQEMLDIIDHFIGCDVYINGIDP